MAALPLVRVPPAMADVVTAVVALLAAVRPLKAFVRLKEVAGRTNALAAMLVLLAIHGFPPLAVVSAWPTAAYTLRAVAF
jgi:hypothetical protein